MFSTSTIILLTLLSPIVVYYYVQNRNDSANGDVHRLPGPMRAFATTLWGHELLAFKHQATQMYSVWTTLCGPVFKIKAAFFQPDIVVVADHAAAQHIFAHPYTYVKSPAFRPPISNLMGEGLVWAEGEDHMRQRKLLASAFTQDAVKKMASDISECSEKLASKLTNQILAASNRNGVEINIVDFTSSCTLDIIGRVALGHDFKTQATFTESATATTDEELIRRDWKNHVDMGITFPAFVAPLLFRTFPSLSKIPLATIQTQGAIKVTIQKIAKRLLERERQMASTSLSEKGNILSSLVASAKENKGEDGLTDSQILDNLSTFAMVGHETTAGSINFTLYELARNPEIQAKLREEILEKGNNLDYDDIQKLPYLEAIVKEGLRVHPASPQTERVVLKDDIIPLSKPIKGVDGKVLTSLSVREGQLFYLPFSVMNTNSVVWGPDAAIFRPERWIVPGGVPAPNELPHGWSGITTFCDGPRNCIGWRLAVFEFKVIIATLVRSLQFSVPPGTVVHSKISPTLQPVTNGAGGVLPLQIKLV